MSNSWYIIVLVGLVAVGALLLLYRRNQGSRIDVRPESGGDAHRDYTRDREDARVAHMSAEDRAWETASLQRNQANTERAAAPADQRI